MSKKAQVDLLLIIYVVIQALVIVSSINDWLKLGGSLVLFFGFQVLESKIKR